MLHVSNVISSSLCYEGIANFSIYSSLILCSATGMNQVLVELAGCELSVFLLMVSVFSTAFSLCLLSLCCAVTLKMNHLPLGAHCFWPNYLAHQRWSYTSRKPRLDPPIISATAVILLVCTWWPLSCWKMDHSPSEAQQTEHPFLNWHKHTHAHSVARVRVLWTGNTQQWT